MPERKPRTNYTPKFKAKIALEAIIGDKSIAEIGREHGLQSTQIKEWKAKGIKALVSAFKPVQSTQQVPTGRTRKQDREAHLNSLFQEIDRLAEGEPQETEAVQLSDTTPPPKAKKTRKASIESNAKTNE